MNYDGNELIARLADEYVLGTLRGRARSRFERMLVSKETARDLVRQAEDRMVDLSLALPAVQPEPESWSAIAARIGFAEDAASARERHDGQPRHNRTRTWRMALAAALAVVAFGLAWVVMERSALPTATARLIDAGGAPLWDIEAYDDAGRVTIRVAGVVTPASDRSYELWALPDGGSPVSLGLLPEEGGLSRELTTAQRTAVRAASKLAVSLEPSGGSRTGAPTGPVLYVAELKIISPPT